MKRVRTNRAEKPVRRSRYARAIWTHGIFLPLIFGGLVFGILGFVVEQVRMESAVREARYDTHLGNVGFVERERPRLLAEAERYEWLRAAATAGGGERIRERFEGAVAKLPDGALTRRRYGENPDPFGGVVPLEGVTALGVVPEFSGKVAAFQAVALDVEFGWPGLFLQKLTIKPGSSVAIADGSVAEPAVFTPEYVVFGSASSGIGGEGRP